MRGGFTANKGSSNGIGSRGKFIGTRYRCGGYEHKASDYLSYQHDERKNDARDHVTQGEVVDANVDEV